MSRQRRPHYDPFAHDVSHVTAETITLHDYLADYRQGERLKAEQRAGFSSLNPPFSLAVELQPEGSVLNKRRYFNRT